MKTINVTFEDEEMELLEIAKQGLSWRKFILTLVTSKKTEVEKNEENIRF